MDIDAHQFTELCTIAEYLMHGCTDVEEIEEELDFGLLITSDDARAIAGLIVRRLN